MCKSASELLRVENQIRGSLERLAAIDNLTVHEQANFANIILHLQKLRLAHEGQCPYCEAERVRESLTAVKA